MKKILIITYLFPPAGGVMVQRVLKFVKHLPHLGWEPTILTVKNPDYQMSSPDLVREVPERVKIIRTGTFEPSKIFKRLRSWLDGIRSVLHREEPLPEPDSCDLRPRQSVATRISNFIFVPDNRVGWVPFAFFAMLRQLKGDNFDMVFSTSPPFSVHLIGLLAKLILKKPWVADLRDMWVLNPHTKPPTKVHLWISKYIEHNVLKLADKTITVSEPLCEDLTETYPDIPPGNFVVIPNGYDSEDFKMGDVNRGDKFTIGYVGSLYMFSGRTPYYFLMALAGLKKEIPDLEKKMEVLFVGSIDEENRKIINSIASRFGLEDMIRLTGFLPYREAISHLKKLDVLLFLIVKSAEGCPSERGSISGKLYEYLAVGKPILALTEEGPIRDLIEKSGCGILVDHDDVTKIKEKILDCYNRYNEGRLEAKPNWEFIARFERRKLTKQLVSVLNDISGENFR
jgi:glycosyltransferase involved in cell wall biosynthesis